MTGKISDFGSLGDRLARQQRPVARGQHVEVLLDEEWVPGLLVAWERLTDGWWGRVVIAADGEASEYLLAARRLRKPDR